jgi:hypothetical protein
MFGSALLITTIYYLATKMKIMNLLKIDTLKFNKLK